MIKKKKTLVHYYNNVVILRTKNFQENQFCHGKTTTGYEKYERKETRNETERKKQNKTKLVWILWRRANPKGPERCRRQTKHKSARFFTVYLRSLSPKDTVDAKHSPIRILLLSAESSFCWPIKSSARNYDK